MAKLTASNNVLVLILAVGVFGILNTEMGVAGIIPEVARTYGVTVAEASLLVSGFALVVAISAPVTPILFSKIDRKSVMLLTLGIFTLCNGAAAFAPTFEVLLALRIVPAIFHPLYTSMSLAVASQMGSREESARATARVMVGVSAGMVLGAPVSSALASASLTVAMLFFALITLVVFVATLLLVPSMPVEHPLSYGSQLAILKKPLVWISFAISLALNGAMMSFYGLLADYLEAGLQLAPAGVSGMLLAYGAAYVVGNFIAGRLLGRVPARTVVITPLVLLAACVGLFISTSSAIAACAMLVVVGIIGGVANNVSQFVMASSAPEAPDFANGLFLTAGNLGTTVFTPALGMLISQGGALSSVPGVILGVALASLLAFARWERMPKGHIK